MVGALVTRRTFREHVQRKATEPGKDLEYKSEEEWLRSWGRSAWKN